MAKLKAPPVSEYEKHWESRLGWRADRVQELMERPPKNQQENGLLWLEFFERRRLEVLDPLLKRLLRPGGTALDIGCGDSVLAKVAERSGMDVKLTGVDFSQTLLAHNAEVWPQHEWVRGDANDPSPGMTYDLVHAGEVLEHLEVREPAMDNWCGCVAAGGAIIITTPTPTLKVPNDQHVGFESQGSIRRAMRRHGIKMTEAYGIGFFLPYHARFLLGLKDVDLRNRLYEWTLRTTYRLPTLATQAIYVGLKGPS
jgi:2-polyprenyl-3-methyl-5-hydroxy-6-metoxy-1,4-benzoquinol methylase